MTRRKVEVSITETELHLIADALIEAARFRETALSAIYSATTKYGRRRSEDTRVAYQMLRGDLYQRLSQRLTAQDVEKKSSVAGQ